MSVADGSYSLDEEGIWIGKCSRGEHRGQYVQIQNHRPVFIKSYGKSPFEKRLMSWAFYYPEDLGPSSEHWPLTREEALERLEEDGAHLVRDDDFEIFRRVTGWER